jgi:hypothetical protein
MTNKDDTKRLQDQPLSDFGNNTDQAEKIAASGPLDISHAPDGGLQAWLVAAGSACIFFSCLGFANSFGVLQEYYMTHQLRGHSEDAIAWIGSISTFIQFAVGALSGPMFDRYGSWVRFQTHHEMIQANCFLGPSPSRCCVRLCDHDDEFMHRILAFHACSRYSHGHCNGIPPDPRFRCRFPIL